MPRPGPPDAGREVARPEFVDARLDERADVGEAGEPAVVEGVKGEWRVDPSLLDRPFSGRTALLSPFDRLVHDRRRAVDAALWIDAHSHEPIDLEAIAKLVQVEDATVHGAAAAFRRIKAGAKPFEIGSVPAVDRNVQQTRWRKL